MKVELEQPEVQRVIDAVHLECPEFETQLARLTNSKKPISVELKAMRKEKTPEQVGYYWAVIEGAAEFLGDSIDGLHGDLMFEAGFFSVHNTKRGVKPRRWSSNVLNVEQYIKLISQLEQACSMAGYTLPPPRKRDERTAND